MVKAGARGCGDGVEESWRQAVRQEAGSVCAQANNI
jgi:hypothetical protein